MTQNGFETGTAAGAVQDVLVSIDSRAAGSFGVVEVDGFEMFKAADIVEVIEHGLGGFGGGEVVAGAGNVARVEAETDAIGIGSGIAEEGNVLEIAAEVGARARGGFKERPDGEALQFTGKLVERFDDSLEARPLIPGELGSGRSRLWWRGSEMGAGMHDATGNSKRFAPLEFHPHGSDGFCPELGRRASEIDEVARVAYDTMRLLGPAGGLDGSLPRDELLLSERLGCPLALVLGKDLDAIHGEADGLVDGVFHSAGDRKV